MEEAAPGTFLQGVPTVVITTLTAISVVSTLPSLTVNATLGPPLFDFNFQCPPSGPGT